MQEAQGQWARSLGWEDPLKDEVATHSSILAWRIPPGGLHSPWGCKESDTTEHAHTYTFSENVYQYWSQEEKTFHCIISIDTEKASDKIKYPVMIKIFEQTRERTST